MIPFAFEEIPLSPCSVLTIIDIENIDEESSPNLCVNCFRHNMQEAA